MERPPPSRSQGGANAGFWSALLWSAVLLGLCTWQGWMTLGLFGPYPSWTLLLNHQPIVSGRHPLHLYHGTLGAGAFVERNTFCCFDPQFQAGYPKTPVFDSDCRLAELFLSLTGGAYRPAVYKIGLAVCCLLVPLLLLLAARGAGLGWSGASLATILGLLIWWGTPSRQALETGDLDLLVGSVAALALAGLLLHFHRSPGVLCWLGLLIVGWLGWLTHPLLLGLLMPLVLVYYLSVGARHQLFWHLALLLGLAGGLAGNSIWLADWFAYWWIRSPERLAGSELPQRTWRTLWEAPCWGEPADRALALVLLGAGAVGAWLFNRQRARPTARLLGLGMAGLLALSIADLTWEPVRRLGLRHLLLPTLLFAVPLAVHAMREGFRLLCSWTGRAWRGVLLGACFLLTVGLAAETEVAALASRCRGADPLAIGLGPEREALVVMLREQTTAEARILWEDRPNPPDGQRWTPLLPLLTGRSFVGGLDSEAGIEHAYATLQGDLLAGRPLAEWNDADLERFCRRYNIGWVVCWSPAAVARFQAWSLATPLTSLRDGETGWLFRLDRTPSYCLKGQARWLLADPQRVALADVVPENGEVLLSLHYQAGMVASPSRVQIEREVDPYDPIPFVRLRVPGPVARVTLTWESP